MDGNPVHFVATPYGNAVTTVNRRLGRQSKPVEAPVGIRNYNGGMQAVDRHDQLREGFSLCSRHGFKKYYQKIALGLMDMAIVNAWIHYKLVNPEKCSNEKARYEFMDTLANSFLQINWQEYYQTQTPGDPNDILRLLAHDQQLDRTVKTGANGGGVVATGDTTCLTRCTPIAVQQLMSVRIKKKGLSCQVCSFEGRGTSIVGNVVACVQHRVRACVIPREHRFLKKVLDGSDVHDYSWRACMPGTSCWEKMHKFYVPNGLFKDFILPARPHNENSSNGRMVFQCCSVGSTLYKKKKEALGKTITLRGRKRTTQDGTARYDIGGEENIADTQAVAI